MIMSNLWQHPVVEIAVAAIRRNRLQTTLTMLGISMGVATVLAMMAVGAGARAIGRAAGARRRTQSDHHPRGELAPEAGGNR